MKKMIIACAVVLAASLSSCGDTNYCYEVTTTVTILGNPTSTTTLFWGTSNELDAYKEDIRKGQETLGISKDAIEITAKRTGKSQSDCR